MDKILFVGIFAACLTTIAFIPQVIKAYQTKHTKDLSFAMLFLFSSGLILWTIYGIFMYSVPIVVANSITLALNLCLVFLKIRYG